MSDELVSLMERHVGIACHCCGCNGLAVLCEGSHHGVVVKAALAGLLPGGTLLRSDLYLVELHVVPQDDFWRFRQHSEMQLLGIAVHAHVDTTGIHPSASVLARGDVIEVAHHVIAQVVLQMLGRSGIARLSACPDAVEVLGLLLQVEAQSVEVVVPVGVLHNHLHLGVHLLGRTHHQLATSIGHQTQSVFRPTLRALGSYLVVVLQVDEEEIVENKVIEQFCGVFGHLFYYLALVSTGIAVGLEISRLTTCVSNASAHLQSLREEELLHLQHGFLVYGEGITMGLQIDLVEIHLSAHGLPCLVEELVVGHPRHILCTDVGGNLEILELVFCLCC